MATAGPVKLVYNIIHRDAAGVQTRHKWLREVHILQTTYIYHILHILHTKADLASRFSQHPLIPTCYRTWLAILPSALNFLAFHAVCMPAHGLSLFLFSTPADSPLMETSLALFPRISEPIWRVASQ